MKTEISTNGEAPVEARERRHPAATPNYERNGSPRFDQEIIAPLKRRRDHYFGDQG
jgi:hypothetical protein